MLIAKLQVKKSSLWLGPVQVSVKSTFEKIIYDSIVFILTKFLRIQVKNSNINKFEKQIILIFNQFRNLKMVYNHV